MNNKLDAACDQVDKLTAKADADDLYTVRTTTPHKVGDTWSIADIPGSGPGRWKFRKARVLAVKLYPKTPHGPLYELTLEPLDKSPEGKALRTDALDAACDQMDTVVKKADADDPAEKLRQRYLSAVSDIKDRISALRRDIRSASVSETYKDQLLNQLVREIARF